MIKINSNNVYKPENNQETKREKLNLEFIAKKFKEIEEYINFIGKFSIDHKRVTKVF